MHDSGGADTCGSEILITSAVAMFFSCSDWDTYRSQSLAIGRVGRVLVINAVNLLVPRPGIRHASVKSSTTVGFVSLMGSARGL